MFLTWRPIWKFLFNFRVSEKFNPPDDLLCFLLLTKDCSAALEVSLLATATRDLVPCSITIASFSLSVWKMCPFCNWLTFYPHSNRFIILCFLYLLCQWMYVNMKSSLWKNLCLNFEHFLSHKEYMIFFNIRKCRKAKGIIKITLNCTKSGNNLLLTL